MAFACSALTAQDVTGKYVLEAGAFDVNGSVRPHVEALHPAKYIATDMRPGPGVDQVCSAEQLHVYWSNADLVISMEMLEHARYWQAAMEGMISVLAAGGVLVLTTRSQGFPLHGYPEDHWRFSVEAMGQIIKAAGLDVERLEPDPDPASPGVFVKARKPAGWAWPDVQGAWDSAGVTPVTG
jgi:SAM-dependent methyltransferase